MDKDNVPLIHAGYLVKSPPKARSSRNFKRWLRRWFVLWEDKTLGYFEERSDNRPKKTIDLNRCEYLDANLFDKKFRYIFSIKIRGINEKDDGRTYFLAADTEYEMTDWIDKICKLCEFNVKEEEETTTNTVIRHQLVRDNGLSDTATANSGSRMQRADSGIIVRDYDSNDHCDLVAVTPYPNKNVNSTRSLNDVGDFSNVSQQNLCPLERSSSDNAAASRKQSLDAYAVTNQPPYDTLPLNHCADQPYVTLRQGKSQTNYDIPHHQTNHDIPPHSATYDIPPHSATYDIPPHSATYDIPPHSATYDIPPHPATYDIPPHSATYDIPPHSATYDIPPHLTTYDTLPSPSAYDNLPLHSTYDTPPHQPTYDTPPHQSTYDTPPHQSTYDIPPHQLTYDTLPHQSTYDIPPHQLTYDTPPYQSTYDTLPSVSPSPLHSRIHNISNRSSVSSSDEGSDQIHKAPHSNYDTVPTPVSLSHNLKNKERNHENRQKNQPLSGRNVYDTNSVYDIVPSRDRRTHSLPDDEITTYDFVPPPKPLNENIEEVDAPVVSRDTKPKINMYVNLSFPVSTSYVRETQRDSGAVLDEDVYDVSPINAHDNSAPSVDRSIKPGVPTVNRSTKPKGKANEYVNLRPARSFRETSKLPRTVQRSQSSRPVDFGNEDYLFMECPQRTNSSTRYKKREKENYSENEDDDAAYEYMSSPLANEQDSSSQTGKQSSPEKSPKRFQYQDISVVCSTDTKRVASQSPRTNYVTIDHAKTDGLRKTREDVVNNTS